MNNKIIQKNNDISYVIFESDKIPLIIRYLKEKANKIFVEFSNGVNISNKQG